ncbi:MAG: thioredoxin family protein [Bacteroidales bacterium]|nr:thioredoxin family protein [Bacteroidales bacterium]
MLNNELSSIEAAASLIAGQAAVLLYFYNDNCAPCISLRPKVKQLVAEDFPELALAFINSALYPELAASYSSFTNPTLILFFEGREYRRESKYISIPQLAETIGRPYGMIFE